MNQSFGSRSLIILLLIISAGEAVAMARLASAGRMKALPSRGLQWYSIPNEYFIHALPVAGTDERKRVYVVTTGADFGMPGTWVASKFAHRNLASPELASFLTKVRRNSYVELVNSGADQREIDALTAKCAKAGVHFAVAARCLWPGTLGNLERARSGQGGTDTGRKPE